MYRFFLRTSLGKIFVIGSGTSTTGAKTPKLAPARGDKLQR